MKNTKTARESSNNRANTQTVNTSTINTDAAPIEWEAWRDEQTAAMEAEPVSRRLLEATRTLVELAEEAGSLCDLANADEPGTAYHGIIAALDLCRAACDELENQSREWISSNVNYYREQLAKYEAAGLVAIADEMNEIGSVQ